MNQTLNRCVFVAGLILLSGCSSTPMVIPEELESQIDTSISFPELLAAPGTYTGQTVLLGGGNPFGQAHVRWHPVGNLTITDLER